MASTGVPLRPPLANSSMAASRIASRRSSLLSLVGAAVVVMGPNLAVTKLDVKCLGLGLRTRRLPRAPVSDPEGGVEQIQVSAIELFFDLVFVFTITRLTSLLTADPSLRLLMLAGMGAFLVVAPCRSPPLSGRGSRLRN